MDIPSIKVLNKNLQLLDEIDLYTSLDIVRQWQGVGSFQLVTCQKHDSLQNGNIIMLGGDGHKCGIIRTPSGTNDDKGIGMTVTGTMLNGLTQQRQVLPYEEAAEGGYFSVPKAAESRLYASAEEIIKTYADHCFGDNAAANRRFPNTVIASNLNRGIQTNWQSRYQTLSDELTAICEYCDCGYELYIDLTQRKYIFEYLSGVDRSLSQNINSRVILSKDFESINSIIYTEDYNNYKNLAYCGGAGEGADRTVLAVMPNGMVNIPEGFERFETFIDCGSLASFETETTISLQEEGQHRLEEYAAVKTLNADIAPFGSFRYGEAWDLGDLVTVSDRELGIMQDMRAVEVRESYEPDKINLSATLGSVPKRLGRVLKNIKSPVK